MKVKETKFKKQSSENESDIVKQFKFQSSHGLCKEGLPRLYKRTLKSTKTM